MIQTRSVPIAALQMVSTNHLKENLIMAERLIQEAKDKNAQLIVLPENFSGMGLSQKEKIERAEIKGQGVAQSFLAEMAVKYQVWMIGCVHLKKEQEDSRLKNSMLVYDPSGSCVARYDKIHLFEFKDTKEEANETLLFESGDQIIAIDTPFGRIGLSICFDLRFPELYRSMECLDLIVVSAAFLETTGKAHWEVLLRARAIENQCYVLASAQGGIHPDKVKTYGHSMLIDPWGSIIDSHALGQGVVAGWLDHGRKDKFRRMIPMSHCSIS